MPAFPIFDVTERTTVAPRWKKYKRKFEILCEALAVTEDKQRVAMLLNYVGDDTFEIYGNILAPGAHTYKDVVEAFDNRFKPQVNYSYERCIFRSMKQNDEETLQEFYIRIKQQASKCNFTNADQEIKQQIELHTINN